MRIELTIEQATELKNALWADDDDLNFAPTYAQIGELGAIVDVNDVVTGYALAHPTLTYEDEIILQDLLEERVVKVKVVKALSPDKQAKEYEKLVADILKDPRKAAKKAAKDAGTYNKKEADEAMRAAFRADPHVAFHLAERKAELEAESGI